MTVPISTDRAAQAAKPGTEGKRVDYAVKGEHGLRLRVTGSKDGSVTKSWSLLYTRKSDGRKCRITLGEYPAMGLAAARVLAGRYRNEIRDGSDPAQTRREEKKAATFEELANSWLERYAKAKKRSWREDERMLKHDILPAIGAMKVEKVSTASIVHLIDTIVDRGASYQANRVLALVRTIFNWAFKRGAVESNPAARVVKPTEEEERERALSITEVRRYWLRLDDTKLSQPMRIIFRLSLLLGQRLNELALARKSEFDLDGRRWDIPGKRAMPNGRKESGAKNKRDHPLPLSDLAVTYLREAFALAGDSEWLFPSPTNDGPIGNAAASRAWGRIRGQLGMSDLQARDLRRSFATIAGGCGFLNAEIGLVLNHIQPQELHEKAGPKKKTILRENSVTATYNRAEYIPEKRKIIGAVEQRILEFAARSEPEGRGAGPDLATSD